MDLTNRQEAIMPYIDYTVRLGDLKRAIMKNPYDPNINIDGYMRYLKYNTPSVQPEILACGEGELNVPDINVGDMISRQMAIEAIEKTKTARTEDGEIYVAKINAEMNIDLLPSAERKGKWINHRNDGGHNIADCSECGSTIQWFDDDEKPRYCCMCGAKMERGEEVKELASRLLAEVQVASEREQNRAVKDLIDKLSEDNDRPHLWIR